MGEAVFLKRLFLPSGTIVNENTKSYVQHKTVIAR